MDVIYMMEQILDHSEVIDLTLTLEDGMPKWPTQPPFQSTIYETMEWGNGSYHRGISMSEHTGTHIDAACHFVKNAESVESIPLTKLMGRGVKIDVTDVEPRSELPLERVIEFEEKYGEIRKGDIVFFYFGWDKEYALKPGGQNFVKDWPGISSDIGEYLVKKKVKAVGCDAMALDADGTNYPNHSILLSNSINILENVANLSNVPPFFACIGFPLKIKKGSGSPIRLVAFVDKI